MPRRKKEKVKIETRKETIQTPQLLRGMKDILPADQPYWNRVEKVVDNFAQSYGFGKIETPILEPTSLFVRAVGKFTDIVEKEMFSFTDQGGENMTLRPEATASIARAYLNHGMFNLPQPVKIYYQGQMFRHERPQAGRFRQFHQFGFETINEAHPIVDAELISVAVNILKDLGIEAVVQINSLGHPECRAPYIDKLQNYYRGKRARLCEDCKRRLLRNPLRLLDCKICKEIKAEAPQIVDYLDEDCHNHFMRVLEYLDDAGIVYTLNPYLVRGLDYYTRTIFELYQAAAEEGAQELGGGGRYDGLIELLGGKETSAAGFAVGIERVIALLRAPGRPLPEVEAPQIFLAQLGESAKRRSLVLLEELRRSGFRVSSNLTKDGLRPQLEIANRLKVRFSLILGQKEVLDGTIIIRDMESGIQEIIDQKKIALELKKKLTY